MKKPKQKQRLIRLLGKKGEDMGSVEVVQEVFEAPVSPTSTMDSSISPEPYGFEVKNVSSALDRLQVSGQQRKQLEIATHLESIHKRIRRALENGGIDPELNVISEDFDKPPVYVPPEQRVGEIEIFVRSIQGLIDMLYVQAEKKNTIIRDVDNFLGEMSLDDSISEKPMTKALEVLKAEEMQVEESIRNVGEAVYYTEELTDKMRIVGEQLMREAGIIEMTSDEDSDNDMSLNAMGKKAAGTASKELKMFNNPAAFSNNTNMMAKSIEELLKFVKGRNAKDQVKRLLKQYQAQVTVTELWLKDLKKREEESISLKQQIKQLKISGDKANKLKEESDMKKRLYERRAGELDRDNQLLKHTNEMLSGKLRKSEKEVSSLQEKLDTVEDEAAIAKHFKTKDPSTVPQGRRASVDANSKQMIQKLKSEVNNLQHVIDANHTKIAALEKELIQEKGNSSKLKQQFSLAPRNSSVKDTSQEKKTTNSERNSSAKNTSQEKKTTNSEKLVDKRKVGKQKSESGITTNESQVNLISNEKEKSEIKELKTEEIVQFEKQKGDLRQEMMAAFDDSLDQGVIPSAPNQTRHISVSSPDLEELEDEGDLQETNLAGSETELGTSSKDAATKLQAQAQQRMVPASHLANMRRTVRAMTYDHQTQIQTLMTHLENEKSRTEAGIRKQEQVHREQLVNVHRQAVQLLRSINRFKWAIAEILEKEMVLKAADSVKKLHDLSTEEAPSDTKEMLNQMATHVSTVLMGIEKYVNQAFLSIRLDTKEKLANQVIQNNLKTAALKEYKLQRGSEYLTELLRETQKQHRAVKENFSSFKKKEEGKYQLLHQNYVRLGQKYAAAKKDMKLFQQDFVEALCTKERELVDTRIEQSEAQRMFEEQKKQASELQSKINTKLEYWVEHVTLSARDLKGNLKILRKAMKENKISFMVHNMTVDVIKLLMEIPLLRIRSIFKRYIKMRRFKAAKEDMENELKELPDNPENREIVSEYMNYLDRVDGRLDGRMKLWHREMDKLEEVRRRGWEEFSKVWEGQFKRGDFLSLTDDDLLDFSLEFGRGDLHARSPSPTIQKKKRGGVAHGLAGLRLPRLGNSTRLVGHRVPFTEEREGMWNVRSSRVKKSKERGKEEDWTKAVVTPKVTELENNQHMRKALRTLKGDNKKTRVRLALLPAEPYDLQQKVPQPISRAFHDNVFRMDPHADSCSDFSESSVQLTPSPTEENTTSAGEAEPARFKTEATIPVNNIGTYLD